MKFQMPNLMVQKYKNLKYFFLLHKLGSVLVLLTTNYLTQTVEYELRSQQSHTFGPNITNMTCVKTTLSSTEDELNLVKALMKGVESKLIYGFTAYISQAKNYSPSCLHGDLYRIPIHEQRNLPDPIFFNNDLNYSFDLTNSLIEMQYFPAEYIEKTEVITCLQKIQTCSKAYIPSSEFELHESGIIMIKTSGKNLTVGEYYLHKNQTFAVICSQNIPLKTYPYMDIITLIGNIISVTSLALTLAVYCALP